LRGGIIGRVPSGGVPVPLCPPADVDVEFNFCGTGAEGVERTVEEVMFGREVEVDLDLATREEMRSEALVVDDDTGEGLVGRETGEIFWETVGGREDDGLDTGFSSNKSSASSAPSKSSSSDDPTNVCFTPGSVVFMVKARKRCSLSSSEGPLTPPSKVLADLLLDRIFNGG